MNFHSVLRRARRLAVIGTLAMAPLAGGGEPAAREPLHFDVAEGLNFNSFLRDGPVAAHLLLRSGTDPRILVAFPAGNSGVGLWFSHAATPVTWTMLGRPQPLALQDERGRRLYGITAEASVSGAAELLVKQAALSSVRVLRDYQALGTLPPEVSADPEIHDSTISWARDRLDGTAGYRLSLQVTEGTLRAGHITAGSDGRIGLKITALTGEEPLTPLSSAELFTEQAAADDAARNALTFLSFKEKFLAGSWRFNTYFGRDTLMSVRLLMPVLTPEAVAAGLGAVLTRLSPEGEVAHEEDIGEFAILDHLHATAEKSDAPTFNYNMIDGSFMLAPVAAEWLLDDPRGRRRAAELLARMDGRPGAAARALGADLASNLRFVLQAARKFAEDPRSQNLIALKPGLNAGQWRDSGDGLAGGRFPYDVNAVFVPAALAAAHRFYASGLLAPYLDAADRRIFLRAASMASVWRTRAGPLFELSVPNAKARQDVTRYAAAVNVAPDAALRAIGEDPVRFHALALAADAGPIPVLHTDEGFELLFGRPTPLALRRAITAMMRPFPAGLLTDVGSVVANPVYAAPTIQARFTRNAYHGTVIWSWQQAVLAAGLQRQLRRPELPPAVKALLRTAQEQLWGAIRLGHSMRNSELWSWTYEAGHFHVAPFGASAADVDESNAAQLWSTVFLAIPDPDATP
ncbi:MAG TPA: hypothetical protein VK130_08535 [Steroidobacteraceae bacterium]|nr:hypothetical protein [Steroidobacteraceae bacterium]